jgi:hypothetical protein
MVIVCSPAKDSDSVIAAQPSLCRVISVWLSGFQLSGRRGCSCLSTAARMVSQDELSHKYHMNSPKNRMKRSVSFRWQGGA